MPSRLLTDSEQQTILRLARAALAHTLAGGPPPAEPEEPVFREPAGAFVTLTHRGKLRGCIGYVEPDLPLWKVVVENAVNAATRDPRFYPLTASELPETHIEVSVLTSPEAITGPEEVRIGTDGLILEVERRRGLLLPQVATEWRFDAKEFLNAVAEKAGLPEEAWRRPEARLWRFQAQLMEEEGATPHD